MSTETPENEAQNQPQTASSAADFRQRAKERTEGRLIELPSGLSVVCKRPSITKLIKTGIIPSQVANSIQQATEKKAPTNVGQALDLMDIIAIQAVVTPTVVKENPNYDAGEISVDDLEDDDKAAISEYVQGGLQKLESFRQRG